MAAFVRIEYAGAAPDTTIATSIGTSDTSLTIASGTGWPTGATGPFRFVIDPGGAAEEKCEATSRSGTTISGITRAKDSTTAATHSAGATIRHCLTAQDLDEANQTAVAVLGASPTVVRTTGNQTVAGVKTYTSGFQNTGSSSSFGANAAGAAGASVGIGDFTDANNGYVKGQGLGANVGLILQPKGTGRVDLDDSAGNAVVSVTGTSKLGFFATTPVVRPTGVAVTAAGIHAALVTLGLITA